jgi:hypothetical protein
MKVFSTAEWRRKSATLAREVEGRIGNLVTSSSAIAL